MIRTPKICPNHIHLQHRQEFLIIRRLDIDRHIFEDVQASVFLLFLFCGLHHIIQSCTGIVELDRQALLQLWILDIDVP